MQRRTAFERPARSRRHGQFAKNWGGAQWRRCCGSFRTWQAGQGKAPDTPVVLPAALQRALVDFISQEVASAKLNLEQDLVSAQQAQRDLITGNEGLAAEIEMLQSALEATQGERRQLEGRYAQLTADFSEARQTAEAQRQAAESARTEIAKLQLRMEGVPRLEAEIVKARGEPGRRAANPGHRRATRSGGRGQAGTEPSICRRLEEQTG